MNYWDFFGDFWGSPNLAISATYVLALALVVGAIALIVGGIVRNAYHEAHVSGTALLIAGAVTFTFGIPFINYLFALQGVS